MRHKVFGKKLGRNKKLRERLFRALAVNFLIHGKMTTTLAKAKAVVRDIEKMVTKARGAENNPFIRRQLLQKLNQPKAVEKLLEAGKLFKETKGGYTKVLKLPNRKGDNGKQALLVWSKEAVSVAVEKPKIPEVKKDKTPLKLKEVQKKTVKKS